MCSKIKHYLKKSFKDLYRGSDKAYGSMDFTGKGYIDESAFLENLVITRIPFAREEVVMYIRQNNLFSPAIDNGRMSFDQFKKTFFPQQSQVDDGYNSDEEKNNKLRKNQLKNNRGKQPEIIKDRLLKLELLLKNKF
jgi:hypothetical protein